MTTTDKNLAALLENINNGGTVNAMRETSRRDFAGSISLYDGVYVFTPRVTKTCYIVPAKKMYSYKHGNGSISIRIKGNSLKSI